MKKNDEWLNTREAAKFIKMSEQTLRIWRVTRKNLDYVKENGKIKYSKAKLEAFITKYVREVPAETFYKR